MPQLVPVTRKVGKIPTSFFRFFRITTCNHVFDYWEPIPSGISNVCNSKIFINHVRIASLGGEISHVLQVVTSWGTGPICVGCGSEATNLSALLGNRRKISAVFWKSRVPTPTRQGQPKKYISAQRDMMDLKGGLFVFETKMTLDRS